MNIGAASSIQNEIHYLLFQELKSKLTEFNIPVFRGKFLGREDNFNNNEVFLRATNHTGQAEKNLLGPAGIRTRDLRFTSPMLYQLSCRSSWELVAK